MNDQTIEFLDSIDIDLQEEATKNPIDENLSPEQVVEEAFRRTVIMFKKHLTQVEK